jgi:transposase
MARTPDWTDAEDRALAALWAAGVSVEEIVAQIGRSETAIKSRASQRRDLCPRRQNNGNQERWTPGELARLADLYCQGRTIPDIATTMGRTDKSVAWQIHARGLNDDPARQRIRTDRDARLLTLVRGGALVPDVAQTLGISATCAYQALRRLRRQGHDVPDLRTPERRDEAASRAIATLARLRTRLGLRTATLDRSRLLWLAGVLDARGSIQITRGVPVIIVTTSRRALVAHLYLTTGLGSIRRELRKNVAVIWRWQTTAGDDCATILRSVAPLMVARRGLAELVAAWPRSDQITGVAGLPPEVHAERERILAEVAHWRATEDLMPDG